MYPTNTDGPGSISLKNFTGDWLRRIEERIAGGSGQVPAILPSFTSLNHGKAVKVIGNIIHSSRPVIEVVTSFYIYF